MSKDTLFHESGKFKVDVLTLLVESPRSGADIRRQLEEDYGKDIPHGRVYQNLDWLIDHGYARKQENEINGKTHLYEATEEGIVAARTYHSKGYHRVRRLPKEYSSMNLAQNG